jgi:hypothetical protein
MKDKAKMQMITRRNEVVEWLNNGMNKGSCKR